MSTWISNLFGPIFVKEMLEIARRKRHYVHRVLYATALLATCAIVWFEHQWSVGLPSGAASDRMARMAASVFEALCVLQCAAVYLIVPAALPGTIASEREANSLELLLTTSLFDREIVVGKLASRLTAIALLLTAAVPVLSLLSLFGGIDPAALARVTAVTALSMLFAGSFAIYFSATTKSTMGAMVRTYWSLAFWLLAFPIVCVAPLIAIVAVFHKAPPESPLPFVACLHPLFLFVVAVYPLHYDETVTLVGTWFFPLSFVAPTICSAMLLWRATIQLRRINVEVRKNRFVERVGPLRRLRDRFRARAKRRATRRLGRPDQFLGRWPVTNPLWLRARLTPVYDRGGYGAWVIWGASWVLVPMHALFSALTIEAYFTTNAVPFRKELVIESSGLAWSIVVLLTAVVSASSVVGDRRRGFFDLVLATPLDGREIFDGSLLAVGRHLRFALLLPWGLSLFYLFGEAPLLGVLCCLITATLFTVLLACFGVMCSLVARRASVAVSTTLLFAVFLCGGLFLLIPFLGVHAGWIVWAFVGLSFVATCIWIRRRQTFASIACRFIAVHLLLVRLATFWIPGSEGTDNSPIIHLLVLSPVFWTLGLPQAPFLKWVALLAIALYWCALIATFFWARAWTIRNLDALVGRIPQRAIAAASTATGSGT